MVQHPLFVTVSTCYLFSYLLQWAIHSSRPQSLLTIPATVISISVCHITDKQLVHARSQECVEVELNCIRF
jgi:hypothetical protein